MHTDTTHCLNCRTELQGAYCFRCGQKASTHRFSVSSFVAHEMVHGIWHIDKGILYTLKHLFTRPGKFTRAYVAGQRAGHFSLVTLLVLLGGAVLFVLAPHFTQPIHISIGDQPLPGFVEMIGKVSKWALLIMVPVMAKASKDLFKKLRYNYTEHLVMNGFFYAGMLCILVVSSLLYNIPGEFGRYIACLQLVMLVLYITIAYRQATRDLYVPEMFARLIFIFYCSVAGYLMAIISISALLYYALISKLL